MTRLLFVAAAAGAVGGCALKGDVRRVEQEVQALRTETARADSARAVELGRIIMLLDAVQDTLGIQQRRLVLLQGEVRSDITDVQRQLVQIQELTGQSQQRLTELRRQLEERASQPVPAAVAATPPDTAAGAPATPSRPAPPAAGDAPGPDRLYELALEQLRRGSPQTARSAFRRFLELYPDHARVPDALFFLGETFEPERADSARVLYERIANEYSDAPRAPAALYRLGLMAEQRGELAAARLAYNRLIAGYPRSEEAELARNKLETLGR